MTTRYPRLTAALCIVFFVAVFGLVVFRAGTPVLFVLLPVVLCGAVNLWLLVKGAK
jgi:hypothetical protein